MGWLSDLFSRKRELTDDELLDAYGDLLEKSDGLVMPESRLPAPKHKIKAALVGRLDSVKSMKEFEALHISYLSLASFQRIETYTTVTEVNSLSKLEGDELISAVLKMGPGGAEGASAGDAMLIEQRTLSAEWIAAMELVVRNRRQAAESGQP